MGLICPNLGNSSETCIETSQVACENVPILSKEVKTEQEHAKANGNMDALFYSGSILSNQLPLSTSVDIIIDPSTEPVKTDIIPANYKSGSGLVQDAAYGLDLLTLREKFYNTSHDDRRTTQKCLRRYGYNGKIDGIWGDKTYFALISYQEPDIDLTDNSVFDGIKNIVANLRNCDAVLNQIIK
jgi:hypothetical protein